jgi:DNA replication protein
MNNYSKLIHSNVISLNDALIQNYKRLNLDEVNMTLLLHLNYQKNNQNNFLSTSILASKMTITEEEISRRILDLLTHGFIELQIDETGEKFSLEPLIDKIADILFKDDNPVNEVKINVSEIIEYCEKTYQRILTADDLKIVNMWVEEYTIDEIKSAVLDSLKAKKTQLRYADAILVNRKNNSSREKKEVDLELQEVLNTINVKRGY